MTAVLLAVSLLALAAEPEAAPAAPSAPAASPAAAADASERAALAAEKAAEAAQKAAEAASRTADLASRLAGQPAAEAAAAATPAAEQKPSAWTGSAAIGLISLTGNSRSFTTNAQATFEYRLTHWIWKAVATGTYGEGRTVLEGAEAEVLAMAATVQLRGDRRLTQRYSAYLLGGADTDHVKSIEARPFGEGGVSIIWIDQIEGKLSKQRLTTDLAFRYGKELRFQYYPTRTDIPDEDIVAPKFGLGYRYALNEFVIFTENFEVLPTVVGDSRVLANSITKVTARLAASLGLGVAFEVRHDSRPAEGKVPTDTALTFSLEAGF